MPTAAPAPRPGSKQAQLIALLLQPDGNELSQASGWLPHTTRAVISGLRKSGRVVTKAKSDDGQSVIPDRDPGV